MKRAISVTELYNTNFEHYDFKGDWLNAFGQPEKCGVWFIYGNSGNGKTSFLVQLAKMLTGFDNVLYNSREEGVKATMKKAFKLANMHEVGGKIKLVKESTPELIERLDKRKSPGIIIDDSLQYGRWTTNRFMDFVSAYEDSKLLIFSSQCVPGTANPRGKVAEDCMYHATQKIWVEGFRAFSKGRYYGEKPYYTIHEPKAQEYWLTS